MWKERGGNGRGGKLKKRWLDNVRADLNKGLPGEEVYDRVAWRLMTRVQTA